MGIGQSALDGFGPTNPAATELEVCTVPSAYQAQLPNKYCNGQCAGVKHTEILKVSVVEEEDTVNLDLFYGNHNTTAMSDQIVSQPAVICEKFKDFSATTNMLMENC